jgi:hypothetical protein
VKSNFFVECQQSVCLETNCGHGVDQNVEAYLVIPVWNS